MEDLNSQDLLHRNQQNIYKEVGKIQLNYKQWNKDGYIKISILDSNLIPIENYDETDCQKLSGNELCKDVLWNGKTELPIIPEHEYIHIKVSLYRASLFCINGIEISK